MKGDGDEGKEELRVSASDVGLPKYRGDPFGFLELSRGADPDGIR